MKSPEVLASVQLTPEQVAQHGKIHHKVVRKSNELHEAKVLFSLTQCFAAYPQAKALCIIDGFSLTLGEAYDLLAAAETEHGRAVDRFHRFVDSLRPEGVDSDWTRVSADGKLEFIGEAADDAV